jgi:hypothetical protein
LTFKGGYGVGYKNYQSGVQKTMGEIKFYRVKKLGNIGWKIYFKAGGERWVGVIVARRFVNPNATGVKVTLQPVGRRDFRFSKHWSKVSLPADKGEARLLAWLTFDEMGVI